MKLIDYSILIVDDEIEYTKILKKILTLEGFNVFTVSSAEEALFNLTLKNYHLVLTDLMMDGINGIELTKKIKEKYTNTNVILMTAYATIDNAVETMKMGADSYFVKGNDPEELVSDIKNIYEKIKNKLNSNNDFLIPTSKNTSFLKVIDRAKKAAKSNANILLLGESGVGKEVFAKYIHKESSRYDRPFISVNSNALQENVLESELFGHSKGSFTGATHDRIGRFETANGGTMFLDEIADTSLLTQSKLLRVLDTKGYEPIGTNETKFSDFRLISATNKNIGDMIAKGSFREDFYYRISTVVLNIPPLRKRPEDIYDLITLFIKTASIELNVEVKSVESEVIITLENYDFPGNIRELKNIIEHLVVFCENGEIIFDDLPSRVISFEKIPVTLKERRQLTEKEHILSILEENSYKMEKSAEVLGITRRQLTNKVTEYGLRKKK